MNTATLVVLFAGGVIISVLLIVLLLVRSKHTEDSADPIILKGDLAPVEQPAVVNNPAIKTNPPALYTPDNDLAGVDVLYACPKSRRTGTWTCSVCGVLNSLSDYRCVVCNRSK